MVISIDFYDELGRICTNNMQDIARLSNPLPNGSALPTNIQDAGVVMHHAIAQPTSPRRTQELCGGLRHLGAKWLGLVGSDWFWWYVTLDPNVFLF